MKTKVCSRNWFGSGGIAAWFIKSVEATNGSDELLIQEMLNSSLVPPNMCKTKFKDSPLAEIGFVMFARRSMECTSVIGRLAPTFIQNYRASPGDEFYFGPMSTAESEILARVISPDDRTLDRGAAEAILALGFKSADKHRMRELAEKAQLGKLTLEEQAEADSYERIGHLVSLLKSKARRSLKAA